MKILLLMHSLSAGGAERAACTLANFWAGSAREVTIVTLAPVSADFYPLDRRVGRISLDLAGASRHALHGLWQNVRRVVALRRLLRSLRPDIALAMMSTPNVLLALASRWLPTLQTIGSERCYPPHAPLGILWHLLRRTLYGQLSAMVALTGECAHWIETQTSASRVVVIPNAIAWPLPDNPPRRISARLCQPKRKRLLAVGRLEPVKNFDALIGAFARLAGAFPDWDLVILGEGPERARLASVIERMGLVQRVAMPGVAGNIAHWYGQADLFALTSLSEGFPNALAEAMAYGVPAVSVDCNTGPRDIVRHGIDGFLVPPDDIAALSTALARVMGDAALRRQLASRSTEARQRFSIEKIGQMWETLFLALRGSQPLALEIGRADSHEAGRAGSHTGNQSAAMEDPAHES
ncbi:glycosyltransferase involved in cell wall biosynthesis [Massilia sp. MP_M2]|uniref:glycosyltransferase family 4 protein n=1 Tax=Massilia sp. MP_M2 TaxID=3071713 RepID=UPI00319D96D7